MRKGGPGVAVPPFLKAERAPGDRSLVVPACAPDMMGGLPTPAAQDAGALSTSTPTGATREAVVQLSQDMVSGREMRAGPQGLPFPAGPGGPGPLHIALPDPAVHRAAVM